MYLQNVVREVEGYGQQPKDLHLKPQEVMLAEQLIETLSEDIKPEQYYGTFQEELRALVDAKQKRQDVCRERYSHAGTGNRHDGRAEEEYW